MEHAISGLSVLQPGGSAADPVEGDALFNDGTARTRFVGDSGQRSFANDNLVGAVLSEASHVAVCCSRLVIRFTRMARSVMVAQLFLVQPVLVQI